VPYTNPYGQNAKCAGNQNTTAGPTSAGQSAPDGFKSACANGYCFQNGEPITVWRNPSYTPIFDGAYRYSLAPMQTSGKVIDVQNGSQNNGTRLQQYTSFGADSQKFAILSNGSGNWKIAMKANTNKCLGSSATAATSATSPASRFQDCQGTAQQTWNITADANTGAFVIKNTAAGRCLDVTGASGADGALMQILRLLGGNNQKFKLSSSY
jgi:hypothetical protein